MTDYTASELRRIIGMIPTVDPTTTEYHILLQSLECFAGIADSVEEIMAEIGEVEPVEGQIIRVEFRPELLKQQMQEEAEAEEESFSTDGEAGAQTPETPVVDQPVEETTYDLVTVRQAMRDAKKRGVDIVALIKDLGATNLTDLPAEKYGELMKKLEE